MRFLNLVVVGLLLAGCALFGQNSTAQDMQMQFITACNAYSAALVSLAGVKDHLTRSQINLVDDSISVVEPLCKGPLPSDLAEGQLALSTVANEVAKIAVMQANAGGSQ